MGSDKMQTLYIYKLQTPQHSINTGSTQYQYSVKFHDFDVNTTSTVDNVLTFFVAIILLSVNIF